MNEVSFPDILNVEFCELWHERIRHVNFGSMWKMVNLNLIPKAKLNPTPKCEVYFQAKCVKNPFQSISRNVAPLDHGLKSLYRFRYWLMSFKYYYR